MQGIKDEPSLTLQIIATGMHLSAQFGNTYQEIEGDGFAIDRKGGGVGVGICRAGSSNEREKSPNRFVSRQVNRISTRG